MEFKAGDSIVHPRYGVGSVVRLEEKCLAEDRLRLYYVVAVEKSTVWVPADEGNTAGLRAVTPRRDLAQYRNVLKGQPSKLERDHNKRRQEINERVKDGSFQNLCEVVRDLTAQSWKRPLGEADLLLLQRLNNSLYREWAVATGVSVAEAADEIQALLH